MKSRPFLLFLACLAATAFAAEKPRPIKALMITGGGSHDYTAQRKTLSEGLAARLNLDLTVLQEGTDREHMHSAYNNPDWAKGYDVVIHNECYGMVKDVALVERVAAPHKAGVPAVILHASMHSYRFAETDAWREVMGQRSMRHAARQDLVVEVIDEKHPLMRGFPKIWDDPEDELYVVEKTWPTIHALAKARLKAPKNPKNKEDAVAQPVVIWTNTTGKVRAFVTTLGHHDATMQTTEYLDLVARGVLWACKKLNDDGTPARGYGPGGK